MKVTLSIEKDLGIIGHPRSMVNCITQEYLSACAGYTDRGYDFDEKNSWQICKLNLRDKFMTVDQINNLYRIGEREIYRRKNCPVCPVQCCCGQHDDEVDKCIAHDEQKFFEDAAATAWDRIDAQGQKTPDWRLIGKRQDFPQDEGEPI